MLREDLRRIGIDRLRSNGWLSLTPPEFQSAIMALAKWRRADTGESVTIAGDEAGGMYGVADGSIAFTAARAPADTAILHIEHAGFWFGVNPVTAGIGRIASATVRTPAVIVHVPQPGLTRLLNEHPEWWRLLLLQTVGLLEKAIHGAADLTIRNRERRCLAVLLRIAGCRFNDLPGEAVAEARVTQHELAAMANLSRSTTSSILRPLETRGLIAVGYAAIAIIAPSVLRDLVNEERGEDQ